MRYCRKTLVTPHNRADETAELTFYFTGEKFFTPTEYFLYRQSMQLKITPSIMYMSIYNYINICGLFDAEN